LQQSGRVLILYQVNSSIKKYLVVSVKGKPCKEEGARAGSKPNGPSEDKV